MIECPSCGRKHRPGTLFCCECGVYLPTGSQPGTEPISGRDLPSGTADSWQAARGRGEAGQRGATLRVKVLPTGRELELPCLGGVEVGRADSAHNIFPDIDLTRDGGLEAGVSRRHCKIYEADGEYVVEDLGSANGTFLDGERLPPYLPHSFEDHNRLQLGRIELEIAFEA